MDRRPSEAPVSRVGTQVGVERKGQVPEALACQERGENPPHLVYDPSQNDFTKAGSTAVEPLSEKKMCSSAGGKNFRSLVATVSTLGCRKPASST